MLSLFFGGNVYELEQSTLTVDNGDNSNIRGYDLSDIRVIQRQEISYADYNNGTMPTGYPISDTTTDENLYVLILKDNSKYYFRQDGKLMMMQDKTGLNKIWYFYQEYQEDGQDLTRLVLVVDTIGREITFEYNVDTYNLETITWPVKIGQKDENGDRSYTTQYRSVSYTYLNAQTTFTVTEDLAPNVIKPLIPYCLASVTDPENNVTAYTYEEGVIEYSYNSAFTLSQNTHLLLTEITTAQTANSYKNKRCFDYELVAINKTFYSGFMQYYKITGQHMVDRHGNIKNDTTYTYRDLGYGGNWSSYKTIIETGNIKTTYSYSVSEQKSQNHVLASLLIETDDGFLQRTNYSYSSRRTKEMEDVLREGKPVYEEKFDYDAKGNLVRQKDRLGLEVFYTYDEDFSIPTQVVKKLYVDGILEEYKSTNTVNSIGQVTAQYFYRNGTEEAIKVVEIDYDPETGNVINQTDNYGYETNTVYDTEYKAFPVMTWQNVTIDVNNNWLTERDGTEEVKIRTWKVFNTDGTVWLEVDNEGYVVEHYYDNLGAEIETVLPDSDIDEQFLDETD